MTGDGNRGRRLSRTQRINRVEIARRYIPQNGSLFSWPLAAPVRWHQQSLSWKRPLPSPPSHSGAYWLSARPAHGLGRLAEVVNQYMGKGKRVCVIERLEYQTWNDKITGELRSRAVIVASQVLFLNYDRAHTGLAGEQAAEERAVEEVTQPDAEPPAQPKRRRRKQAA
jgi:hypothetical protein